MQFNMFLYIGKSASKQENRIASLRNMVTNNSLWVSIGNIGKVADCCKMYFSTKHIEGYPVKNKMSSNPSFSLQTTQLFD